MAESSQSPCAPEAVQPDLLRLDIFTPDEMTDAVTGILVRNIAYGWEEESLPTGETRFAVHCDNTTVAERVEAELAARASGVRVERATVPRQDWTAAWREFSTPVPAGPFLVLPPWLADVTPEEGRRAILIEPKSAFGTGHHNSTTLCLRAVGMLCDATLTSRPLQAGMRFFDIGTGTGILGIACTLMGLSGIGADIDPVAVENALENAALNHAEGFAARIGSVEAGGEERFDIILANILAGPLRDLAPEIMARLKPEGRLVLSGLLDIQADAVEAAYAPLGPARRLVSGDWVALIWGLNSHGAA